MGPCYMAEHMPAAMHDVERRQHDRERTEEEASQLDVLGFLVVRIGGAVAVLQLESFAAEAHLPERPVGHKVCEPEPDSDAEEAQADYGLVA